jgi:hypothetical protein
MGRRSNGPLLSNPVRLEVRLSLRRGPEVELVKREIKGACGNWKAVDEPDERG